MAAQKTGVERRKAAKRIALLDAAFRQFTEKGFGKTSISDITREAEVAKGTFYLYFRDKYDLRTMLIARKAGQIFEKAREGVELSYGMDFGEVVVRLSSRILDLLEEDKALVRFLSKNLSWGLFKKDLAVLGEGDAPDLLTMARKALEDSPVRYRELDLMLFLVVEFLGSASYSAVVDGEPMGLQEMKPYLLGTVRKILEGFREG